MSHLASLPRNVRVAFYSPGMVGIGHMRRNLLVAQALSNSFLKPITLLIAESREANVLSMPAGGDCLTLPALRKEYDGKCQPRSAEVGDLRFDLERERGFRQRHGEICLGVSSSKNLN